MSDEGRVSASIFGELRGGEVTMSDNVNGGAGGQAHKKRLTEMSHCSG